MSSEQSYLPGMEGAELRRDLSQFMTPAALAQRLWDWTLAGGEVLRLVEPSAGTGALLRPVFAVPPADWSGDRIVTAVEADPAHAKTLRNMDWGRCAVQVLNRDFLVVEPQAVDVALQNTPFENDQDIAFVERSLLWAPRVCGIFPAAMFYSAGRAPFWRRVMPTRIVHLSERPQFGGDFQPMTNFVVMELKQRNALPKTCHPEVQWW